MQRSRQLLLRLRLQAQAEGLVDGAWSQQQWAGRGSTAACRLHTSTAPELKLAGAPIPLTTGRHAAAA